MISDSSPSSSSMQADGFQSSVSRARMEFEGVLNDHLNWFNERQQTISFWWRDDDAIEPSPELEELLGFSAEFSVPLSLAVIPKFATAALAQRLENMSLINILQHGWQHKNYQSKALGEKASEFGRRRAIQEIEKELANGQAILQELFGNQFIPLFVPPWNRIAPETIPLLRELGPYGLSTFTWISSFHLPQVQSHLDIIKWKKNKRFIGWDAAARRLDLQLCRRRTNPCEPIGLLTHHLDHGEGCSEFLEVFFSLTTTHPAAQWLSSGALLEQEWNRFNQIS
ncbi:polysaccharide deacetylase family protein [Pseudovibrio sp. Tun.PSC04-5.I4]|uniref:polysaccharide deacetylase family protein n=1 Tax=Pseudovibrio sp. Tun.PSC04-5.I4 TaxID=1798213 RepID=UPI000891AC57|nr:polysaccharide deacetylase family protein [Pseudovibrio sp. Tun.PSC04-5.I4]SDQ89856.1 hypothetical protein SAMN04515695_1818 [Pseudovibrio sp. Tun.PSC04-5.I4]